MDNLKVIGTIVAGVFIVGWFINKDEDESTAEASNAASTVSESQPEEKQAPTPPPEPRSPWSLSEWTSEMDDSPAASLRALSEGIYSGAYGGRSGPAYLHLRCLENTTTLQVRLNGHFLADSGGYGRVTYRVDDQQARTVDMRASTDNEWLGLWSGGRSIPVIQQMFGHEKVAMRITPHGESPTTITFPIAGLEDEIQPLRDACNW